MKELNAHIGVIIFFIILFIGVGYFNLQIDIKEHQKKTSRKKRPDVIIEHKKNKK